MLCELVYWVTIQRLLFWLKHLILVSWSFLNTSVFYLLQITVNCIENLPPVDLVLGEHLFLSVGDYFSRTKKSGWLDWRWTVFLFIYIFSPCTTLFCPGKNWGHLQAVKIIIFVIVHTLHVLKETNASWSYALFQSLCCSVINIVYNVRLHYTCTTKKKTGPNAITIRNFFFIFHSSLK